MQSLLTMGLRAFGILGRFALTIFIARYLGYRAVGTFGLVQGASAVAPAVIGFGLNYVVSRSVVGMPIAESASLIRDRIIVTISMLAVVSVFYVILTNIGLVKLPEHAVSIVTIIALECVTFDLYMSLIGLKRALSANIVYFIKSALWVLPVCIFGLVFPLLRTMEVIFIGWIAGLICSVIYLAWIISKWPRSSVFNAQIDTRRLYQAGVSAKLIYLSDLGLVGQAYADRFIIEKWSGLFFTGVYTFVWSICNAIYTLVYVSLIQPALPDLVEAYRARSNTVWTARLLSVILKALLLSAMMSGLAWIGLTVVAPAMGIKRLGGESVLLGLVMLGAMLRVLADTLNYGMYSRHIDDLYAWTNIGGFALSVTLSVTLVRVYGIYGVAASAIVVPAALSAFRVAVLRRNVKETNLLRANVD